MKSKRCLVIGLADPRKDLRLAQHLEFLEEAYQVTAACFAPPQSSNIAYLPLKTNKTGLLHKALQARFLLSNDYDAYYWQLPAVQSASDLLSEGNWDLIIAHGIEALPLAIKFSNECPVIFDALKHLAGENNEEWTWSRFMAHFYCHIATIYLPRTTAIISSSCELAEDYTHSFNVSPEVIFTTLPQHKLPPKPVEEEIRLVYFGKGIISPQLNKLLDLFLLLDPHFTLDLIFSPDTPKSTLNKIKKQTAWTPRLSISSSETLTPSIELLNEYDLALFLTEHSTQSLLEKFFACVQARIGMITTLFTDGNRLIIPYQLGTLIANDHLQTMAYQLNHLSMNQIFIYKKNAHRMSNQWTTKTSKKQFLQFIEKTMQQPLIPTLNE